MDVRKRQQVVDRKRRESGTLSLAPRADLRQLAGNRAVATLMRETAPGGTSDPLAVQERVAGLRRLVETHKAKPGKEALVERLTREAELKLLQDELEKYNRLLMVISKLLQMHHDAQKAVIQNFRA